MLSSPISEVEEKWLPEHEDTTKLQDYPYRKLKVTPKPLLTKGKLVIN